MTEYQRAVRMPARQPWKSCRWDNIITWNILYMLKRRNICEWTNLVMVLQHVMILCCIVGGYKSPAVTMYRGQLYNVTHWIKSCKLSGHTNSLQYFSNFEIHTFVNRYATVNSSFERNSLICTIFSTFVLCFHNILSSSLPQWKHSFTWDLGCLTTAAQLYSLPPINELIFCKILGVFLNPE